MQEIQNEIAKANRLKDKSSDFDTTYAKENIKPSFSKDTIRLDTMNHRSTNPNSSWDSMAEEYIPKQKRQRNDDGSYATLRNENIDDSLASSTLYYEEQVKSPYFN